jgi:hypothetical protein
MINATPDYILEAAAMFGFTTECTNAMLNGMVLESDASGILVQARLAWIKEKTIYEVSESILPRASKDWYVFSRNGSGKVGL